MGEPTPERILLLTHARTASHLLERLLSQQPGVKYSAHAFAAARPLQIKLLNEGPYQQTSSQTREELKQTWKDGYDNLLKAFDEAKESKMIAFHHMHPHFMLYPMLASTFVYGDDSPQSDQGYWHIKTPGSKNESYTSCAVIPDETLLHPGTRPIFTIRHPGVMVPSIWKIMHELEVPSREAVEFSSSLEWSRMLYDWYAKSGPSHGIEPIIVDADDYMSDKTYVKALCERVGLDPEAVIYSWPKASEEELNSMIPMVAKIKSTILGSDGLIQGKTAAGFDMAKAEQEWISTYGEEAASKIKQLVEKTMPDYEYMRGRKMVA